MSVKGRLKELREKLDGPESADLAVSLMNLGNLLRELGDLEAARPPLERAIAIQTKLHGDDDPKLAASLFNLGKLLDDLGDLDAAEATFEKSLALFIKAHGDDAVETAAAQGGLAMVLDRQDDLDGAIEAAKQLIALEPEDPLGHTSLSIFYQRKGMIPEAEEEKAIATKLTMEQNG